MSDVLVLVASSTNNTNNTKTFKTRKNKYFYFVFMRCAQV
jgi:hypothetical protein